jgi:polyphosphate glucokinase
MARVQALSRILAFDIGGSFLKGAIIDARGKMLTERSKVPTPAGCTPRQMVDLLVKLAEPFPPHDHIAIGFPGVVRGDRVLTAPHWGPKAWQDFPLAKELSARLGKTPARLINDAEMQGLAVIKGKGLELVLTLGTGAGTGLFRDGQLTPHLELAHHPIHKDMTYNDYVGNAALADCGKKHWNRRVQRTIAILDSLLHYDHLYIGGGNATRINLRLPSNVSLVSNDAGIEGGAALWRTQARDP